MRKPLVALALVGALLAAALLPRYVSPSEAVVSRLEWSEFSKAALEEIREMSKLIVSAALLLIAALGKLLVGENRIEAPHPFSRALLLACFGSSVYSLYWAYFLHSRIAELLSANAFDASDSALQRIEQGQYYMFLVGLLLLGWVVWRERL
jgi:hypothetical protein